VDAGPGRDPVVKILDLGIGRLLVNAAAGGGTHAGMLIGTPDYMSPEQCQGKPAGPTSDLYSLGAVLYQMLFGEPPFKSSTFLEAIAKHLTETPVWPADLARELGVPPEAEAVVLRALRKHPEERHESLLELQRDVANLLTRVRRGATTLPISVPRARVVTPPAVDSPESKAPTMAAPRAGTPVAARAGTPAVPRTIVRVPLSTSAGGESEVVEIAEDTYWVGRREGKLLECNSYLRVFRDGAREISMLVDPGPPKDFSTVVAKVSSVLGNMERLNYVFLNHQDPDVAMNAAAIQQQWPQVHVLCSQDTWRLSRFYGLDPRKFSAVESYHGGQLHLATGHDMLFVPTPFCHFRGAVALYDPATSVLFSGDLFGGTSTSAGFVASEQSLVGVAAFHQIYMPSGKALLRAVTRVGALEPKVKTIAPQHGSVVVGSGVERVLGFVAGLRVGFDLMEADERDPQALAAANAMIAELGRIEGDGKAGVLLRRFATDGSFVSLFDMRDAREIAAFRVESRLALGTILRDAVLGAAPEKQDEVRRALEAARDRHLRGKPRA